MDVSWMQMHAVLASQLALVLVLYRARNTVLYRNPDAILT
jgi:hypothetical protein